ncbi:hypothetical protein CY34DRAFT_800812 [Suillus luteus UH-Slu-Lm8-n1]|uniref:Uncharacterized protein n=1 Tax=Suillus luteus UH-Slu-Lm8-n1 TaxID=930992 RepID=A0A0D0BSW0_9AGAM|nr:hypothetical protein CY34DRAFT_800812 [Suillus luteus UH-Slu-Lm8-n1]
MSVTMPSEFVSEPAAFPLQLLDSTLKNSADLGSDVIEDKQVDDHVQPLSSSEFAV